MRKYLIVSTAAIIASGIIVSSAEARTRCVCQKRMHSSYQSYDDTYSQPDRHIYHHHYYYSNQDHDRDSERHVYHHLDHDSNVNVNVNRNPDPTMHGGMKPEGRGGHQGKGGVD